MTRGFLVERDEDGVTIFLLIEEDGGVVEEKLDEAEWGWGLLTLLKGACLAGELIGRQPIDGPELPVCADLLHHRSVIHGRKRLARVGKGRLRHEILLVGLIVDLAD